MIKPAPRKTKVSNTKNIEVCERHTRHRRGTYKCTLYTNLQLEEKVGSLNATQVSRISTKHQNFNLDAR